MYALNFGKALNCMQLVPKLKFGLQMSENIDLKSWKKNISCDPFHILLRLFHNGPCVEHSTRIYVGVSVNRWMLDVTKLNVHICKRQAS